MPCAVGEAAIDDEEQQETEIEPIRTAPSPVTPSASEVEEHRITHAQYRSWCKECVEGKALGEQRGRAADDGTVKMIPVVGLDYFFITSSGISKREDLKDMEDDAKLLEERKKGKIIKCLIVRCSRTKAVFAHQVPVKGVDEDKHVVNLVCKDIEWLGHTKVILKCDNEPAIKKLVEHSLRALRMEVKDLESITKEHPERYESQSNGMVEVGIKILRGHFRTLKSCLERRIGATIPVGHPVMAWLLGHCCLIINAVVRGEDGLTAWARARATVPSAAYRIRRDMPLQAPPKGPRPQ